MTPSLLNYEKFGSYDNQSFSVLTNLLKNNTLKPKIKPNNDLESKEQSIFGGKLKKCGDVSINTKNEENIVKKRESCSIGEAPDVLPKVTKEKILQIKTS